MSKNIIIPVIFIILLILTLIFSSLSSIAQHPGGSDGGPEEKTITYSDNTAVGTTWETTETGEFAGKTILSMVFELTWTDDEGSDSEPDTFTLQTDDETHVPQTRSGSGGTVIITWDEDGLNDVWNIAVTCDSAGPTNVPVGPLGLITQEEPDPGNSWTLVVTYTYTYIEGDGPGGPPAYVQAVLESPVFKVHVVLMISSTFLFLATGIFAGVFLFARSRRLEVNSFLNKITATPKVLLILVILAFLAFFIASVPIGMWVSGMFYGWNKAWTGFPAIWNEDAFLFTNADNVSFIVLLLWAIPIYLNRAQIMKSKWYKKLFGWSKFMMGRAEKAPDPRLQLRELALCYFFMGFFVYLVFMVQPHGSG